MENRMCKMCGEWFPLSCEFFDNYKNSKPNGGVWTGFRHRCKKCRATYCKGRNEDIKQDPEEYERVLKIRRRAWKRWAATEGGKKTIKICHNRPQTKIAKNLRGRIRHALQKDGMNKSTSTTELLGCSIEFCRDHLASQFTDNMDWDNYGKWHIDHIRPCASFDLADAEQQRVCFHYTNLQPLWAKDNMSKGDKWEE